MHPLSHPPRLAVLLLTYAARRWPAEVREQSHRAWLAELYALTADPGIGRWARTWQALRFSCSLAVHRPAPSAVSLALPAARRRPGPELFGAAVGVAIFGTLTAMLLVHLPAVVADRLPHPDSNDPVHRLPLLALVPALVLVGVVVGRRLARRDTCNDVTRTVAVIVLGLCFARLLPIFGGIVIALPGLTLWAIGLWAAAQVTVRLAHHPRGPWPWTALALGMLALADIAVTSTVWLDLTPGDAPLAYALSWFPNALLEPAVLLPMGTDPAGDPIHGVILDSTEFLPHVLIIVTAFALAYVHTAARTADSRALAPQPV